MEACKIFNECCEKLDEKFNQGGEKKESGEVVKNNAKHAHGILVDCSNELIVLGRGFEGIADADPGNDMPYFLGLSSICDGLVTQLLTACEVIENIEREPIGG